jgi:hypothetical protein
MTLMVGWRTHAQVTIATQISGNLGNAQYAISINQVCRLCLCLCVA